MVSACEESNEKRAEKSLGIKAQSLEDEIQHLIHERRACDPNELRKRAGICKEIKKLVRQKLAIQREERIERILLEF